eukprot:1012446_1
MSIIQEYWELCQSTVSVSSDGSPGGSNNEDNNSYSTTNLTCALLSTFLERLLGDIFCSVADRACPSMLRDLLETRELLEALGSDCVRVLRGLIGPPTGLNLRNVVWHGFAFPGELHPGYASFMFVALVSVWELAAHRCIPVRPRELRSLDRYQSLWEFTDESDGLSHFVGSDTESLIYELIPLVQASNFQVPGCDSEIIAAFREGSLGRLDRCLCLILPIFEHCLRLVFVSSNNLPSGMVCAQSEVLYTTFDSILATKVSVKQSSEQDGVFVDNTSNSESSESSQYLLNTTDYEPGYATNHIIERIGQENMEALWDLLRWTAFA